MKPFSASYFIKENKKRVVLLVFMFILTYTIYLAGLYLSNIEDMFGYNLQSMTSIAEIYLESSDEGGIDFQKAIDYLKKQKGITLIQQGVISDIRTKSIMGVRNGFPQYAFRNVEDFQCYCKYMGIVCDMSRIGEGSVIMSSLQADNRNMKIGDKLKEEDGESISQDYRLDAITDEEGYTGYYINNGENKNYIILSTGMDEKEFQTLRREIKQKYYVSMRDYESLEDMMDTQLGSLHYIYFFIVFLLAAVMAITIHAAFVGMYQHRKEEYAIYRAIGISKREIIWKVMSEIVLIDVIGMLLGVILLFVGIYLLNELYLLPHGQKLFYYNRLAFMGMVVSNVLILIPSILLQSRKLWKANICDY